VPIQIKVWTNIYPYPGTPQHVAQTLTSLDTTFTIDVAPFTQKAQHGRFVIERCVSNAKRPLLWYRRRHEAEGDGGGVGAAAATGDGVAGERTLARDRRAHGGGGVQRRLAVAGGGASAWCGGVGAETRPGSAAEIDGAATRALAAAARPRGARPRVRDRSLDDQAGSDGDHA